MFDEVSNAQSIAKNKRYNAHIKKPNRTPGSLPKVSVQLQQELMLEVDGADPRQGWPSLPPPPSVLVPATGA